MNCEEVMELMQRSLDGDLSLQEQTRMTDHIRACPECAVLLERLVRLSNNLADLPRVEPRFSLVDAILPKLDQIDAEREAARAEGKDNGSSEADAIPAAGAEAEAETEAELEAEAEAEAERAKPAARPSRPWKRRLGAIAAAAAVVAAVILSDPSSWLSRSEMDRAASDESESFSLKMMKQEAPAAENSASADEAAPEARGFAVEPDANSGIGQESAAVPPLTESNGAGEQGQAQAGDSGGAPASEAPESGGSAPGAPARGNSETEAPTLGGPVPAAPPTEGAAPGFSAAEKPVAGEPEAETPADGGGTGEASGMNVPEDSAPSLTSASIPSPDGSRYALVESERLKVYAADGAILFESGLTGSFSDVRWSEDGAELYYAFAESDGKATSYAWSAEKGEQAAP